MPDERVSDERLAELVADAKMELKAWGDCVDNHELQSQFVKDGIAALTELQARRQSEREALLGAEEMSEKISTDIAWDFIDLGDDPDYRADQFRRRLIGELAPLYAKLARQAALLGECREYVQEAQLEASREYEEYLQYPSEGAKRKRLLDEATATLAKLDALKGGT